MSPLGAFFFRRLSQIQSQHESMFASKLDHAVRAKQLMLEGPAALKASWLTSWHSAFLTVSNLISQDICCWLCLEPDCLKFLELSQLFICRGEMRRAISKAMSTSIGTLASIHEVRVYRRASRMPQPAGCRKTRLLVIIHYVCMTVRSCPAKDIAPMKTLPDARLNLKHHLRNHFQRHQCSRVEPQSFMLRCFHCLKHRHWMLQLLFGPIVIHNTTLLLSWSPFWAMAHV